VVQVDAALDPSHTQNIGKLIKEQFSQAQFLIVSLKDGMFNNANVLFRTQFVDGSSTVRATRNGGSTAGGNKRGTAKQPPKKAGRKAAGDDQENYVAT
jgi:structural maintenance of chromosome 2